MAERAEVGATDPLGRVDKATETFSQFVARVLDQLSLSAWLPAAALVLSVTFVFQLGAALDGQNPPKDLVDAIGRAFGAMAKTTVGGALLLFAAVVVLTMLTQAFAFEAIRTLEGYWGTFAVIEWMAQRRSRHFSGQRCGLDKRYRDLTRKAWKAARDKIEEEQTRAMEKHHDNADVLKWTPDMLAYLGGALTGRKSSVELEGKEQLQALGIPWKTYAPPDLLRRRVNLDKRLRDYPNLDRILPTRLGNVLRKYEDQTNRRTVETFILKIYDDLPPRLRALHDEQRNRLDLYCSMIFVVALVTAVAGVRLGPHHALYAGIAITTGVVLMWLTYRAAVASARIYGVILTTIADRFPER
jgi:hypothetical protein